MLIYEKKLKKDLREIILPEGVANGAAAESEQEQVRMVSYRNVEKAVPDWIKNMVQKDNVEYVIDRQVFNTQFF